jgi:hypothetical protein
MLETAALGVAIVGDEGCSKETMLSEISSAKTFMKR